MIHLLYIGIGGFFGAIARFIISKFLSNFFPSFPFGTLTVNVIGSFILGFIMYGIAFGKSLNPELRDFITIGFVGAFTTMSAFAYESFRLAELSEFLYFALNLFLNVFLCILAVFLGRELTIILSK